MSDLTTRLRNAGRHVRPQWSPAQIDATVLAVRRKRRRFGTRAAVIQGVALLVATTSAGAFLAHAIPFHTAPPDGQEATVLPAPSTPPIVFRASSVPSVPVPTVGEVPAPSMSAAAVTAIASDTPTTNAKPPTRIVHAPSPPPWRELAKRGAYDEAYEELRRQGGPKDEVNDLLLAADVARLGHHAREAVRPLRQIVETHAADPRASLAAFTLGRVLLETLAQPQASAEAFANARRLSPDGALAEDALAREVEARSRAGESSAARTLALEYVKAFPRGARIRSVRHLGGLD